MKKRKVASLEELKREYQSICDTAGRFQDELCHELTKLITDNGLKLGFPIQKRIKTWASIKEKIINQGLKFKSIKECQDLVGLRSVFLYRRDLTKFEKVIKDTFIIKKQYDTSERLKRDQFGYASIHFIIQLPKEWLKVPTLSEFGEMTSELQIRTLSQHIWAEVSHELQYKSLVDVPQNLVRPIYRASALLETVDLEFERLLLEREEYRNKIDQNINQELNVDNIEQILDGLLPLQNKSYDEEYAQLNKELINKGINDTEKLRKFVFDNLEWILSRDKERVKNEIADSEQTGCITCPPEAWERVMKGYFYTHTGLMRAMLNKELGIY